MGVQNTANDLLLALRLGHALSLRQQLSLIIRLSLPAILAQISSIVMQYIDAAMAGRLGADASAAIGLVSTTTWLFGGVCMALTTGFTVQVAQHIGASNERGARSIMKQGLVLALSFSLLLTFLAVAIHRELPFWLGGEAQLAGMASNYFVLYMLALPFLQTNSLAGGMLQGSGNMRLPSMLSVLTCFLDVVYNALLIFPTRRLWFMDHALLLPGAGLGVSGAALGTALASATTACMMLFFLLFRSPMLRLHAGEGLVFSGEVITRALKLALPVGFEQLVMCGAQVASTKIVAPLGTVAIAANSFAITAESLCYMPGYGIALAATTLIGQSIGAKRTDLIKRLAWMTTLIGMLVMGVAGVLMYFLAPLMMASLSPDAAIQSLGSSVLRIEAFAEPLYAASIVATGVFRGAGDTLVPSVINFISMWFVRLPLAVWLTPYLGLRGVWLAMCIELCVRGALFLGRLARARWQQTDVEQ